MAQPILEKEGSAARAGSHDIYTDDLKNVESEKDSIEHRLPTDEERATLRLVSAPVPWAAYAIAIVEFAERASYYGCIGSSSILFRDLCHLVETEPEQHRWAPS